MGYTWEQVADGLMVSRTTLWRRLTEIGISLSSYSDISDSELDGVMELLVRDFPRNGIVMMWGQLQSMNIFVTRQRVHQSLLRVSPQYVHHRHSSTTSRRVYNVPSPNYLWHIDGLHCLIHWKIVIHGGIDGFSRRIVYLHASCNNRAETVLHLFRSAVRMFGWPLRVRSDKGRENVEVARAMILARGTGGRASLQGVVYTTNEYSGYGGILFVVFVIHIMQFFTIWKSADCLIPTVTRMFLLSNLSLSQESTASFISLLTHGTGIQFVLRMV